MRNLAFENLERRRLLAADVQVVHDPVAEAEVGELVTRTIRVFSDEATEVSIRSFLTDELDNPTWKRFEGQGNQYGPYIAANAAEDFQITGQFGWPEGFTLRPIREIGDFNGDGKGDFLVHRSDATAVVLYGGVNESIDMDNSEPSAHFGPTITAPPRPLFPSTETGPFSILEDAGDVNGDGFDDLSYFLPVDGTPHRVIVFGGESVEGPIDLSTTPSEHTSVLEGVALLWSTGDLNNDGIDELIVGPAEAGSWSFQFYANPPVLVSTGIAPGISVSQDELLVNSDADRDLRVGGRDSRIRRVAPIGDFNADGFNDAVILGPPNRTVPAIIYGGSDSPRIEELADFNSLPFSLALGEDLQSYDFAGSGDVNGDGITDLAFFFNGGHCLGCTSSSYVNVTAGIVVMHGGDRSIPNGYIRFDKEAHGGSVHGELLNLDGDQFADVHVSTRRFTPRELTTVALLAKGQTEPLDIDLGHLHVRRDVLDGDTKIGLNEIVALLDINGDRIKDTSGSTFLDINGDGIHDTLSGSNVHLGSPRASVSTGSGDIEENIQINKNASVIYEVSGTLKSNAQTPSTIVLPMGTGETDYTDNSVSDFEAISPDIQVSTVQPVAQGEFEVQLTISNNGPFEAKDLAFDESISSTLQNVEWSLVSQPFPATVDVRKLLPGSVVGLTAPTGHDYRTYSENQFNQAQRERYLGDYYSKLGESVGSRGDVTGDGIDDFYISRTNEQSGRSEVLMFSGANSFGSEGFPEPTEIFESTDELIFASRHRVFADLNGDGLRDRITAYIENDFGSTPSGVAVVYGTSGELPQAVEPQLLNGSNGFRIENLGEFEWFGSPAIKLASGFDVNGDGVDDLLIGHPSGPQLSDIVPGEAFVVLGRRQIQETGTGALASIDVPVGSTVTISMTAELAPGQPAPDQTVELIPSDGQIDLITGRRSLPPQTVELFRPSSQVFPVDRTSDSELADLDGDGDLDTFLSRDGAHNQVWFNDGLGTFTNSGQELGGGRNIYAAQGDVDQDGDIDMVVAKLGEQNELWINDGSGNFVGSQIASEDWLSIDVALGDLDGDDDLDLFVANGSGDPDHVFLNEGGRFSDSGQWLGSGNSKSVELVDINDDGSLDALVANDGGGAIIWLNDGEGNFADNLLIEVMSPAEHMSHGDIDNDGDIDLAFANARANEIWLNNGDTTFTRSEQTLGDSITSHVQLADFDSDGDLDLIEANWLTELSRVWINDGMGSFSAGQQFDGGVSTEHIAIGDLDDDGDLDLYLTTRSAENLIHFNTLNEPIPSDITGDGEVNFDDFLILSANFGRANTSRTEGDIDRNGSVDFADFLLLAAAFGTKRL